MQPAKARSAQIAQRPGPLPSGAASFKSLRRTRRAVGEDADRRGNSDAGAVVSDVARRHDVHASLLHY